MNTILTDDELEDAWCKYGDEMGGADQSDALRIGREIEAAVLAKLREQEPVAWLYKGDPWFDGNRWQEQAGVTLDKRIAEIRGGIKPLYAAPLPAVVQVPQEFDYKHPRAQALIGADARHRIIIDLVWQILEDPRREFTASDMEYWDKLHDKVQEVALAALKAQAIPAPWREAVKVMRRALVEAEEAVADWGAYASEHFQNKHDLDGDLRRIRAAIALADSLEGGE